MPEQLLSEKREIDTAIAAVLHETGMAGEIIAAAMLKDEYAALTEQPAAKHEVGNLRQLAERIGRVGKDNVELLPTGLDEAKHVGT